MGGPADRAVYAVTLERGTDGTYLAWVDELSGCALRAASRAEVLDRVPGAIADFVAWTGAPRPATVGVEVAEEVESAIQADEDTEVIVSADRAPLTTEDWRRIAAWAARSRAELVDVLGRLSDDDLAARPDGRGRTVREELEHIGFVELMYAAWTFDLRSRKGSPSSSRGRAGSRRSDWRRWPSGTMREPHRPTGPARRGQNSGRRRRRRAGSSGTSCCISARCGVGADAPRVPAAPAHAHGGC